MQTDTISAPTETVPAQPATVNDTICETKCGRCLRPVVERSDGSLAHANYAVDPDTYAVGAVPANLAAEIHQAEPYTAEWHAKHNKAANNG